MDIRKPAYRARPRVKANKHANGPPKASTEHDHKSKPNSTPIDLRKPNPSYDDRTIDTLSIYPLLLCPIDGYQHPRWDCLWTPTITIPLLLYPTDGYQHNIGTSTELRFSGRQMVYHIAISPKPRHALKTASCPPFGTPTNRSLCHTFVALSDPWISTSSLSLSMDANEHNPLTLLNLMSAIPYVCL